MVRLYQTSLGFKKLPDPKFDNFGANVIVCLKRNVAFPNLPIPVEAITLSAAAPAGQPEAQTVVPNNLTAIWQNYHDALLAVKQGGPEATAAKNEARLLLEDALTQEALYVQNIATTNLSTLLSSGFDARSTNHSSAPLAQPAIQKIVNGKNGQLVLHGTAVENANGYLGRMKNGTGDWVDLGYFSQSRTIEVDDLTPGQTYTFQLCAVGAGGDSSAWSDAISHMAM